MNRIFSKAIRTIRNIFNDNRGEVRSPEKEKTFQSAADSLALKAKADYRTHLYQADTVTVNGVRYSVISAFPTSESTDPHGNITDKLKYLVGGAEE